MPAHTALLFIDVQNFGAHRQGGEFTGLSHAEIEAKYGYYFAQLETVALPNMQRLQAACRAAGIEVMYTRDREPDARTAATAARLQDHRLQRAQGLMGRQGDRRHRAGRRRDRPAKTSSSVFISTNIDYVLRNLGVRQLVIAGLVTDQCVECAVRDACDLGYLVTLVTDACAAYSRERHDNALRAIKGYCRQRTTDQLLAELGGAELPGIICALNAELLP